MRCGKLAHLAALGAITISSLVAGPAAAISLVPGHVVVTDEGSEAIVVVDPATGVRTIVSSSAGTVLGSGPALTEMDGIAVAPGGTIYVGMPGLDGVISIDPATGNRTLVTGPGIGSGPAMVSPGSVAIEANGNLLVWVFRVDPLTGNRVLLSDENGVGSGPNLATPVDIILESSGDIVTSNLGADSVIRVSALTGNRTIVSDDSTGSGPDFFNIVGIALEADGTILAISGNNVELFRVDPLTGDRTVFSSDSGPGSGPNPGVGSGTNFENIMDVDVGLDGIVYAIGPALDALFAVDPLTGNRTIVSGAGTGSGPAFGDTYFLAVVPIPEPATGALLALGLLGISSSRRHRRR